MSRSRTSNNAYLRVRFMPGRRDEAPQLAYWSERRPYEQEQVEVPRSSLLYTKPPEASEVPKLPLQALAYGFQVILAEFRILWVVLGVGQRHEDHPPSEGLKGSPVYACQAPEEVPAACPGEAPYPVPNTSTTTHRRTPVVPGCGVLEGECRHRPPQQRRRRGQRLDVKSPEKAYLARFLFLRPDMRGR